MPYASDKQKRLMQAVAHNPAFAKQVGIPQSVGKKFEAHKAKGGEVMAKKLFGGKETYAEELKEAKAIKSGRITPQQYARGEQKEEAGMKKMKKMADGGITQPVRPNFAADMAAANAYQQKQVADTANFLRSQSPALNAQSARSMVGARPTVGARMSKGGSVGKMGKVVAGGSRPHGEHSIQQKGHTKGTMVKMAGGKGMKRGGKC